MVKRGEEGRRVCGGDFELGRKDNEELVGRGRSEEKGKVRLGNIGYGS